MYWRVHVGESGGWLMEFAKLHMTSCLGKYLMSCLVQAGRMTRIIKAHGCYDVMCMQVQEKQKRKQITRRINRKKLTVQKSKLIWDEATAEKEGENRIIRLGATSLHSATPSVVLCPGTPGCLRMEQTRPVT